VAYVLGAPLVDFVCRFRLSKLHLGAPCLREEELNRYASIVGKSLCLVSERRGLNPYTSVMSKSLTSPIFSLIVELS
jgi:hypothetical protein